MTAPHRETLGHCRNHLVKHPLGTRGGFIGGQSYLRTLLASQSRPDHRFLFAIQLGNASFGARPLGVAVRTGLVVPAAQGIDVLLHRLEQSKTDHSLHHLAEQFRCFAFSALQKGLFQFFAIHGGGLVFLDALTLRVRPTNRHSILTIQGTLPGRRRSHRNMVSSLTCKVSPSALSRRRENRCRLLWRS